MSETNFHGAVGRLHVLGDQATIILARPPIEPIPAALARPGEVAVHISVAEGASWPDPFSLTWAAAALQQDGVVALVFASLADAEACAARLTGKRVNAPGGRA
jgi:hypothetical protein